MQKLLAILIYHLQNMRVIHWNVTGRKFFSVHGITDDYIKQINSDIDKVAEFCLQLNIPIFGLRDAIKYLIDNNINITNIEGTATFAGTSGFVAAKQLLDEILTAYEEVVKNEQLPSDIISELETSEQFYRLESRFKLTHACAE